MKQNHNEIIPKMNQMLENKTPKLENFSIFI